MMRAKLVFHIITGLEDGGAEAVLSRLCFYDAKNKHHVISLTGEGKYGHFLRQSGVDVTCLNMSPSRISPVGLYKLFWKIKRGKPEVVQTWMYHSDLIGGVVAKLAGCKNIVWNIRHSDFQVSQSKKSTLLVVKVCSFLSSMLPNKIVCCARSALEEHSRVGYDSNKMTVIENGYLLNQYTPNFSYRSSIHSELNLDSDQFIVGMVGRFNSQKNHIGLLEALRLVKKTGLQFVCLLVGKDLNKENQSLVESIDKSGLTNNIILLDQRVDISAIMNALDVHVLSSSFGEGFPNVIAESMACGTPCIATDVGDAKNIIGSTGWIVNPKNDDELAKAILSAYIEKSENQAFWRSRKVSARERIVNNYGIEKMVNAYHRVWFTNN